jgi:hypothetical protein
MKYLSTKDFYTLILHKIQEKSHQKLIFVLAKTD